MINEIKIDKIMNLAFLITLFFIPIEMAMTLRIGPLSPFKISLAILLFLMIYTAAARGSFMTYVKSFVNGFMHFKWAIVSIVLYFAFDIISLAWTDDVFFSVKKYITIIPMLILAVYACYYLYRPRVDAGLRKTRLRNLALVFGLIALFLSVLTWIIYLIFGRTYYILSLSLQSDYNQYVLPIFIGYVCGIYYINTMKSSWQRYVLYFAYSLILMPNFYLSGSRRVITVYLLVFFALGIYFTVTNLSHRRSLGTLILSICLVLGVFLGHKVVIEGHDYYSTYVYESMEEEAKRKGIKAPSAQMDKSEGIIHGFRLEQNIDFKQDTLESGAALNMREAIWTVAFNEIKNASPRELLLGQGGSAQRDIYRTEEARDILFPDGHDPGTDFHPHSMILLEMVNGGLVKTGLVISIVLAMVYYAFVNLFKGHYHEFILIGGYGAILLSSQLIDSIYGLLENRMTWIFFFIVLASLGDLADSKYKLAD